MAFIFTRKKGQKIIVLNDKAMPLYLIEMAARTVNGNGGMTHLRISSIENGEVSRKDVTRADGEQFEAGDVVFSVDQGNKSHRTAFTIEKHPSHMQAVKYETYQQAANG